MKKETKARCWENHTFDEEKKEKKTNKLASK